MSKNSEDTEDGMRLAPISLRLSHPRLDGETQPRPSLHDEDIETPVEDGKWSYNTWLHEYEDKKVADDIKKKHLALTWRNLTVTGVNSQVVLGDDVLSFVNPIEQLRASRNQQTMVQ